MPEASNTVSFQRLILSPPDDLPAELFFRGEYTRDTDTLLIPAGSSITFDTYFGSFSVDQWLHYTTIETIAVDVVVKGSGYLKVWRYIDNNRELVDYQSFNCFHNEAIRISLSNQNKLLEGLYYLSIDADSESVILSEASFVTTSLPSREIKLACCFCTFKREKELLENVDRIVSLSTDRTSPLQGRVRVFVADNAGTLVDHPLMRASEVEYFENPNYGGSAGYARCMIEACLVNLTDYTHVVLIDDDARIEPFVLERLHMLLSYLKQDYEDCLIGSDRFSVVKPWIRGDGARRWIDGQTCSIDPPGIDMRCYPHEGARVFGESNYTRWYLTAIPRKLVSSCNLPLPFFFQADDVEYGIRSGSQCIYVDGICVWHPDLGQGGSPAIGYYKTRNSAITTSLHLSALQARRTIRLHFIRAVVACCLCANYEEAASRILGFEDYLSGPESLDAVDPRERHSQLLGKYSFPKYLAVDGDFLQPEMPATSQKKQSLFIRIIAFLLPAWKRRVVLLGTDRTLVDQMFTKSTSFVDVASGTGYVLTRRRITAIRLIVSCFSLALQATRQMTAITLWKEAAPRFQSLDYWVHYLHLAKQSSERIGISEY